MLLVLVDPGLLLKSNNKMSEELIGDIIPILLIALLVVGVLFVVIKGIGSSNSTTIYGATAELYNKDKQAAMETIVEVNAKKKMQEQTNGEPE